MVRGMNAETGAAIVQQRRRDGFFADQSDLVRRCALTQATLGVLADSGALNCLSGDRRAAYWQALGQEKNGSTLPLFGTANVDHDDPLPSFLTPMHPFEEVVADYDSDADDDYDAHVADDED